MKITFVKYICLILTLFGTAPLMAQTAQKRIQILDSKTLQPVPLVHFSTQKQHGLSDEHGTILINHFEDCTLKLSHLSYGQVSIPSSKLAEYLESGKILLEEKEILMQPTEIILVKSTSEPAANTVINQSDKITHDAGAFMDHIPGVSTIKKSGSYGFDPVFRGFKYEQLNIIMDGGQNASAACPSRMDPPTSQVSINMTDRVEFLKGPYSLRYGNAIGGTFNFISPEPTFTEKAKIEGRVTGGYESNGNIIRSEAMLGLSQKINQTRIFSSYSTGDDYSDGNAQKVPASFSRLSSGITSNFKIAPSQVISLSATYNVANDVDFPSLPMDLRFDHTLLLNTRHSFETKNNTFRSLKTLVYGSFVDHRMDNFLRTQPPRTVDASTDANTETAGARTEALLNFGASKLYTGLDTRLNFQSGERTRKFLTGPNAGKSMKDNVWQDAHMQQLGTFAELQLPANKLLFITALRIDYNHSFLGKPDSGFVAVNPTHTQSVYSLSFNAGFTSKFSQSSKIGLWLGRGQRAASTTEMYINYFPVGTDAYEMLGNPALKPEINYQADVNYTWQPPKSLFNVNLFVSSVQNYISSTIRQDLTPRIASAPGVRQYINIKRAMITGFEVGYQQEMPFNLLAGLTAAYTYAEDNEHQKPLPEIPPLDMQLVIKGSYFAQKIKPEVLLRHAIEQKRISAEYGESPTESFTIIDAAISYTPRPRISFLVGAKNLTGTNYYEHLSRSLSNTNNLPLYNPGRSVYAILLLQF